MGSSKSIDVTNPTTVLRLGPKGVGMTLLGFAGLALLWRGGQAIAGRAGTFAAQAARGTANAVRGTLDEVL